MIKLPAYFTRFGSKSDGSAGLSFATQELDAESFGELQRNLNQFGWLIFSQNEIKDEDIPDTDAEDDEKTPSKRIRAVIFIRWKQQGKKGDFESYYRQIMESLIDKLKAQLD